MLILTLWETRLFLKASLCMFERGKEREGERNVAVGQSERRILAYCVKPGLGPVPWLHRAQFCLPSKMQA